MAAAGILLVSCLISGIGMRVFGTGERWPDRRKIKRRREGFKGEVIIDTGDAEPYIWQQGFESIEQGDAETRDSPF